MLLSTLDAIFGFDQFPTSETQVISTLGEVHNEFAILELKLR
jgi:hypothetical protein